MTDIYSWVLSPEMRGYLREKYRPNIMERQALIRGAYRSVEEKLSALRELCPEAETADERFFLERVIKVYQFAIQEIRQCRRGEFYFYRTALQFGGDSGLFAYPFSYLGDAEAGICRSYEQLGGGAENCVISSGYTVQKRRRKGEWGPILSFELKPVDGIYQTTRFYLYDPLMKQTNITREEWENSCDPERHCFYPYPFPFSTGDLVYLDAPLFEQPVYGVLCRWTSIDPDRRGETHTLLGYIENGRFHPMDLSGYDIAFDGSGYRVIDWIHSASAEKLPAGQEILGEIGAYLRRLNCEDWAAAKDRFIHIFVRSQRKPNYVPYHVKQAALSELFEGDI